MALPYQPPGGAAEGGKGMYRRIRLGKMLNLRDLGGYPASGGKTTRWGRMLRGDNPAGLSQANRDWLLERGITTVIDLRSPAEIEKLPDELAGQPGFAYRHLPLSGGVKLPMRRSWWAGGTSRCWSGRRSS